LIVDSSALVAIILQEPEEAGFTRAIVQADRPRMSAAAYLEVALRLDTVQHGVESALDETIDAFGIEIVAFTPDQARAARVAHNRFGRARHAASLKFGDCMTYALAATSGEPLLFKGDDFKRTDLQPAIGSED